MERALRWIREAAEEGIEEAEEYMEDHEDLFEQMLLLIDFERQ